MDSEAGNNDYDDWLAPVWQPPITPCTSVSLPLSHPQLYTLESSIKHDARVVRLPNHITATSNTLGNYSKACIITSETPSVPVKRKLANPNQQTSGSNFPYKLMVIRQPEEQHRARYLSEGSRGAIKDRSGSSHCTIQLSGYYRPTRVELYASSGAGPMTPHPLYQLIPVSGKSSNTTPCQKVTAADGIECLEVILRPETSMTAVLDCMGLLKICSYDAKHKRNIKTSSKNAHLNTSNYGSAVDFNAITMAQNSVRIVMRAYIPVENARSGEFHVVQTETEPIRCVQQLGVPEVLKMSLTGASAKGEAELFIIGRNFDRNTKVVFREYKEDGTLGWSAEAYIDKHYLHQCHIVCTVPAYYNLFKGGTVSVTVICASKSSHPKTFVYTPSEVEEEEDDWRPPGSPHISAVDSFDFGSVYNEANSTQNQQLVKTANLDVNPYSTAMPFFDYDGGNSNPASGHSSDQLHSCSSLRSSFQYSHSITAEEDQESYEPAEKRHFQKQQSSSFSASQYDNI